MTETVLLIEDRDAVRILSMNRPLKLNALNSELIQALHRALEAAEADNTVRALVLRGVGRAFCAGADTSEFDKPAKHLPAAASRGRFAARTLILLQALSKPIVSVVQGVALGAGSALAIGCDMMVAVNDLSLGYPEIKTARVPAIVMPSLQRQVGRKLAFEMISMGRLLSASEAREHGLANRVVAPDEALDEGLRIASDWAHLDPTALAATKSLFYRVADLPFDEATRAASDVSTIVRSMRATNF
ncbi:MAG TPA: enoyl-CoA hydratase/isomerase family protein [Acidimicrobiales bacterium]